MFDIRIVQSLDEDEEKLGLGEEGDEWTAPSDDDLDDDDEDDDDEPEFDIGGADEEK